MPNFILLLPFSPVHHVVSFRRRGVRLCNYNKFSILWLNNAVGSGHQAGSAPSPFLAPAPTPYQSCIRRQLELKLRLRLGLGAAPSLGDKRLGHVRSGAAKKNEHIVLGSIKSTRRR